MQSVPLLSCADLSAPFAYAGGRIVSAREWLGDVKTLACLLPPRRYLLNCCEDRYRFSVAFAAAMLRGQTNLLPPSRAPEVLRRLREEYADTTLLAEPGDESVDDAMPFPLLSKGGERATAIPTVAAEQIAAILFTSGSTGLPTGHAKPWGSLARAAAGEAQRLDLPPRASLVGTVPPQHMYGLESTVILTWQHGCLLHSGRPFYPSDIFAALAQVPAPRVLVTTPLHLKAVLAEGTDTPLPAIARIVSATSPLSQELAAQAERVLGAAVFEIYGCTEAGMVASRHTVRDGRWRLLPGVEIRQDGGHFVAQGGHVPQPATLADELQLIDEEHFELLGRLTDVINIAGKRTSLASLNSELLSIPGVLDGIVFLPPESSRSVTRLSALVRAPTLTREQIVRSLRLRIDPVFLPRPLYLVDAPLPRSATGKLPRAAVLELAAALEGKRARRKAETP
jgi:acyl-coenzyme A synthetase/AMP-(fatty) acid ligase